MMPNLLINLKKLNNKKMTLRKSEMKYPWTSFCTGCNAFEKTSSLKRGHRSLNTCCNKYTVMYVYFDQGCTTYGLQANFGLRSI